MDTTSLGFKKSIAELYWSRLLCGNCTPSTTYKGLLEELMELKPRIRTLVLPPGRPELVLTCTPATLPDSASLSEVAGRSSSCSASTWPTEPVRSDFLLVP